jgi:UDP-glucose 4-epimerase
MKKILVTGGLGFIGSHTVVELQNEGFEVVIVDNLSNTTIDVLDKITEITGTKPAFHKVDVRVKSEIKSVFDAHEIDGIIHFAAFKAVGESMSKPLEYYENNVSSLIYILQEMRDRKLDNFIFSSSCTVYGQADVLPVTEEAPVKAAESVYGNTKQIGEEIIRDTSRTYNINSIALRYFNPIGAHSSGLIGENPKNTPENIMPYLTQVVDGKQDILTVYGNDYPTKDGSGIRDYIHIMDLTEAHCKAIEYLSNMQRSKYLESINIGTGTGVSVLELISEFEKVTGNKVPFKIGKRRPGDVVVAYADIKKAKKVLGWKSKYSLSEALKSAWSWEKTRSNFN